MIRPGQSPETVFGENNNLPFADVGKWLITSIDMNIKISKEAYEKLIKEDLYFLNEHCPDSLELDHIKVIIFSSIDWYYPDENTCTALKRIENRLKVELQKQKDAGKQFLSDQEIDGLIDSILKEE